MRSTHLSDIRGRIYRQIYRLALSLLSPEMLSSLSKFSYYRILNVHLALFCPKDDTDWNLSEVYGIYLLLCYPISA